MAQIHDEFHRRSSRLSGFYKRPRAERLDAVRAWGQLNADEAAALDGRVGLDAAQADHMIENAIGVFALPLGVVTNFLVNGRDVLVPMVVEEPSVVAAVSNAARLVREGGGFTVNSDEPVMIGQIQVLDVPDLVAAAEEIMAARDALLAAVNDAAGSLVRRGGGARDVQVRTFADTPVGSMLVVHLHLDTRDAMGANAVNTVAEALAPHIEALTGGRVNLRILTNLTDQRLARAQGMVPTHALGEDGAIGARRIVEAWALAHVDPYRAATHNKGIMNGVDAVAIATGNDWRALEAGAHAYAARDGVYRSLTHWSQDDAGNLHGVLEMPLAVGIVGGATRVHPAAQAVLKVLGVTSAKGLAEILAAVGLAQNLAALRALTSEGIQQGHMRMHAKQLAVAAGARGAQVERVVARLLAENTIRYERAQALVQQDEQEQSS